MNQERIAELREEIARNKATGYHDEGIGTFDSPTMETALEYIAKLEAALDKERIVITQITSALAPAQAELADARQCLSLFTDAPVTRAERDAGRVVPDLTDDELDIACGPALDPMFGPDAIVYGMRMARREGYKKAWADLSSRISPPSVPGGA